MDKNNSSMNLLNHKNIAEVQSFVATRFGDASYAREERIDDYQKAWKYYRALGPIYEKASFCLNYVEPVLQEVVDSITPSLLNIFCENDAEAVKFRPTSKFVTSETVDSINKKVNDIFLRENNGYEKLFDSFIEVLVTGDVYGKVYATEKEEVETAQIDEWMPAMLADAMLEEYPDTDPTQFKFKTDKETGAELFKTDGAIELKKNITDVEFDYIPFGEVFVDPIATSIEDARYVCHRMIFTKGELYDMFPDADEESIASANTINALSESNTSNIKLETLKSHTSKDDYYSNTGGDESETEVYMYEHYLFTSLLNKKKNDKSSKLYKICSVDGEGNTLLSIEEVCDIPIIHGTAIPLPDSFWGISLYSMVKGQQDLLSYVTSEIAMSGTSARMGRYTAVKGAYDRKSLLDGRPGGVVEVEQAGAVQLFPYHQFPQQLNDLYGKVKDDANAVKGNAVAPGLENSLNNVAASTVALAVQNSEMKDKKIAKQLAYTFIRPIFEKIYKTICNYNIPVISTETDKPLPAGSLPSRYDWHIDVNTSNDAAREAGQMMNILQTEAALAASQSPLIPVQQRYNMYEAMFNVTGVPVDNIMVNPKDAPPPTPEQIAAQQEAAKMQKDLAKIQFNTADLDMQLKAMEVVTLESDIQRAMEKNAMEAMSIDIDVKEEERKKTEGEAELALDVSDQSLKREVMEADVALTLATGNSSTNISTGK